MRIGILYIGIGRYSCFWQDFYSSCEKYCIPEAEKHYYVFTDQEEMISGERVEVFHQDNMEWPFNTLYRFKMFHRITDKLAANDYLFFFNANALFKRLVTADDLLPQAEDYSALCIETDPQKMTYERRPESVACIPEGQERYYFSGALNGGKTASYIQLIEECDALTDKDYQNNIIPIWHDESILNKFLWDKNVKVMTRQMGKPENWRRPFHAKIILRKKESVLGREWLRNFKGRKHTNTLLRRLLRSLGLVKDAK